jgi:formylmethanofuran dehydrogenase subunit C
MAGSVVTDRRTSSDAPALGIGKRFKGFRPEEEKASRKADVKESEAIRQMKNILGAYLRLPKGDNTRGAMSKAIKNLRYTAKDVEEFSLVLVEFQDEEDFTNKAGFFLSDLINNGRDSDYVIHTQNLPLPPHYLGFKNCKNITVEGDVGDWVGDRMRNGSIIVKGDAGDRVGDWMKGGSITIEGSAGYGFGFGVTGGRATVEGNAGDGAGEKMEGGSVIVKGSAGNGVGDKMKGGSITLQGDVGDRLGCWMKGGHIIVKGDAGRCIGIWMKNGRIVVNGNAGSIGGDKIKYLIGGEIHIEGEIEHINNLEPEMVYGTRIFHKGKLIWPTESI